MAQSFYTKETVLLEFPKGRDVIKVEIGDKILRNEPVKYLDIRAWYTDDAGDLQPGKGFGKPLNKEEMIKVGQAILDFANSMEG